MSSNSSASWAWRSLSTTRPLGEFRSRQVLTLVSGILGVALSRGDSDNTALVPPTTNPFAKLQRPSPEKRTAPGSCSKQMWGIARDFS